MSGGPSRRTGSGRKATCRPRRESASARLCPTMPEPRTSTSNRSIGGDCRQPAMTLCREQGHNLPSKKEFEMAVWLRRGAIALGGLLIIVVAVATWFVATFDANRYKGVAIDWMK